jgi:hypothetical protein
VFHDAANPTFCNITGDFSLAIGGTQTGFVNLIFGYVEGGGPCS